MNARWRERELTLCGVPLETVTYSIVPLGDAAGLVQAVPSSRTLRQLCRGFSLEDRHLRVLHALQGSVTRLDRLAASTAAYLTACYSLGVGDGHDDNIRGRKIGATMDFRSSARIFRIGA
ncbi:unnamed protein product [Prorocentrum cordatum]|uniref:PI3K/PI4K catalytic domain-containing protein n=2 Tax=Prorocentrum cordatum TaxID=2364126 RepID=A0ABN9XQL0_9DINO|nr:unnamed protein product [Polarella glacialis]